VLLTVADEVQRSTAARPGSASQSWWVGCGAHMICGQAVLKLLKTWVVGGRMRALYACGLL
jgi:hypothetical protein